MAVFIGGGDYLPVKANLGIELEELLTLACLQYSNKKIANINKIPTPYKIIGKSGNCLLAVPDKKSTVDYIGEYQGQPFAMEAKKTNNKTFYPIDPWNREEHQREFLRNWQGLKYYYISFWNLQEDYLVPFYIYEQFLKTKKIPLVWLRGNLPKVVSSRGVVADFLNCIENIREENVV